MKEKTRIFLLAATFVFICFGPVEQTSASPAVSDEATLSKFYDIVKTSAIRGHNTMHLDVVSKYDCAEACNAESWCKSFDFSKSKQKCDLSKSSVYTTDLVHSKSYSHYYKKSVLKSYNFRIYPRQYIKGHNTVTLKKASRQKCISECSKLSWCKSFDYHRGKNKCDLSDINKSGNGGKLQGAVANKELIEGISLKSPQYYDHYEKR